jgi:hypothetical protein
MIGNKLMTFGVNGVFVFQGVRSWVIKQIFYGWVFHSMGMHCMVHETNLTIQILFHFSMANKIKVCYPHFITIFVRNLKGIWSL